jgi:2-amino-4-hydroxy-6-hydroxymethyldihydropteridine diphosphokinase
VTFALSYDISLTQHSDRDFDLKLLGGAVSGLVESSLPPKIESLSQGSLSHVPGEYQCWISFGGNVGDVKATFDAALALLSLHCHIQLQQRSGLYCSTPMGSQAGSPFLNSICGLKTQLSPQDLLSALQSVETQLGRVREICWGPRTLDLDLLSYGNSIVNEPRLVIPHPALTYRRFVLDPLVEIDAKWRHPVYQDTTGQIRDRLSSRPLLIRLLGISAEAVQTLSSQLSPKFPDVSFAAEGDYSSGALPFLMIGGTSTVCDGLVVDLRHSPGDLLEQLTSALTAIFDAPQRVSDW